MLLAACVHAEKAKPITQEEIQKFKSVNESIRIEEIKNVFAASAKVKLEVTLQDQTTINHLVYSGSSTILKDADEGNYFALTAAHVLRQEKDYDLKKIKESKLTVRGMPAEVLKYDRAIDLALLRVFGELEYFKGKIASEVLAGEPLISIGYPRHRPKTVFTGELLNEQGERWYASLGPISKGVSGSGVYSVREGKFQLVGIVVSKNGDHAGIIPLHRYFLANTPLENEYCQE